MKIGYIRVSTLEQHTDRQIDSLSFCDKIFEEKISGKDTNRPKLKEMLEFVKEGDVIYITELSRLGRSMIDLYQICDELRNKKVDLKSLKENISLTDDSSMGKFTFAIFSAMAEFERNLIKERQKEGIKACLDRGKPYGRPQKYNNGNEDEILQDYIDGNITRDEAISKFGCKPANFSLRLKKYKERNNITTDLRKGNNKKD